jgi:hypothetical protein
MSAHLSPDPNDSLDLEGQIAAFGDEVEAFNSERVHLADLVARELQVRYISTLFEALRE